MQDAQQISGNANLANQVLHASAAETATGTGPQLGTPGGPLGLGHFSEAYFELDVSAAATAVGDTLDVSVQTTINGVDWVDVVHFTQVLGNGLAKRFYAKIAGGNSEAMFSDATALAAGSVRNLLGDAYRCKWTIASSSAPSFTFSLTALFRS